MPCWAAVKQQANQFPSGYALNTDTSGRHAHTYPDIYTLTHTASEGRCMSACQKHSGNERSTGAAGNTRERVPALHPLLSLPFFLLGVRSSLLLPLFVTLLAPLAFHSHLFLFVAPPSLPPSLQHPLFSPALLSLNPSLPLCLSFSSFAEIYRDL